MTPRLIHLFLLIQVLHNGYSLPSIRPPIDIVRQIGRGGGGYGFFSKNRNEAVVEKETLNEKPSDGSTINSDESSTSLEPVSSWNSFFDNWVQQPAKKIYKRTIPWVFGSSDTSTAETSSSGQRHVEQYEIFGMWRLSVNDGDTVLFMKIRPHDLSYGRKQNVAKYTFQFSDGAESKASKLPSLVSSGSSLRFEHNGRIYSAKLARRRIEDEDGRRRWVLKISGNIYKEASWWWPQFSAGKFVGRKLGYRELSREEATIWGTPEEDDGETDSSSVSTLMDEDSDEDDL